MNKFDYILEQSSIIEINEKCNLGNLNLSLIPNTKNKHVNLCEEHSIIAGDLINQQTKKPIDNAILWIFKCCCNKEHLIGITCTNKYGQFVFRRLELGYYIIKVKATGYKLKVIKVKVNCPIVSLILKMNIDRNSKYGTISGVIRDTNNKGINNADVILYKVNNNNELIPINYTKTDKCGVYLFTHVKKGTYKIKSNKIKYVKVVSKDMDEMCNKELYQSPNKVNNNGF